MRKLKRSPRFERAFRKFVKRYSSEGDAVKRALDQLSRDPFHPSLRTHKLKGKLSAALSCSCGYDCRIIFRLRKDSPNEDEYILLEDIGLRSEVY